MFGFFSRNQVLICDVLGGVAYRVFKYLSDFLCVLSCEFSFLFCSAGLTHQLSSLVHVYLLGV